MNFEVLKTLVLVVYVLIADFVAYKDKKELKLRCTCVNYNMNRSLHFVRNIFMTSKINDDF